LQCLRLRKKWTAVTESAGPKNNWGTPLPPCGDPRSADGSGEIQSSTSNEAITINLNAPPGTPNKTRRTIPTRKRARKNTETTNNGEQTSNLEFTAGNGSKGTWLEEVAWLIAELKEILTAQTKVIESLRAGQEELKLEQRTLVAQNAGLRDEVRTLQEQLKSPSPSWASVVASGTATASSTNLSQPSRTSTQGSRENILKINTPQTAPEGMSDDNSLTRYMEVSKVSSLVTEALRNDSSTQEVQVAGVRTTRAGYLIRFKDKEAKEKAWKSEQWLKQLGTGVNIAKPRFGVVVHRTPTNEVPLREDKAGAIDKIVQENNLSSKGYNIEEVAWLKRKDSPLGATASLGVWFDSAEAAEWAIQDGMLFGPRHVGSVEAYKKKERRCYNCQATGHEAWSCKQRKRCGHCAGEHGKKDCPPGSAARCVECDGNHPTGAKECVKMRISSSQQ
jgi:hypothetical protein